ncbi:unnamed protein product [Somion occarium]|uniref:Zn(2)-C6 fungal-type domain-containing protein n=1 Tax=Somion occarium TaxID=3059160 RepID=A0ABP1DIF1_9APHY
MADHIHYPPASHTHGQYLPPTAGYGAYGAHAASGHLQQLVPPTPRPEATQRKRPKYTRSKTGCLTCRAKKIKCDETKPNCMRCTHGQRECTWPEGVPARKKSSSRKNPQQEQSQHSPSALDSPLTDTRPSTAGSATISEASTSTPPTRNPTPPKREPSEAHLPPLISRRAGDVHLSSVGDIEGSRRQHLSPSTPHGYPMHSNSNTHVLPAIPEMSSQYPTHSSYQQQHYHPSQYAQQSLVLPRVSPQHEHPTSLRSPDTSTHPGQWSSQSMMTHVEPLDQYYTSAQERGMVGPASHHNHVRY